MQKTAFKFFASLILSVLFFSCVPDLRSMNIDNWIGKYGYREESVQANAGYNMVMIPKECNCFVKEKK